MEKRIKMFLWGNPGVGKSTFAAKFPKPFFICTDGNYEWLEEFGAKPDAHLRVFSFKECVKFIKNNSFDGYDTIVVDLIEDLFKMCEQEWLKRNEIEHPSDMGWGKGYDGPRNEFFIEMTKLLNLDKNIIFICHAEVLELKQKRGTSYHVYKPSSRLPEKLLDMFEGRVRCMVRALSVSEEIDGKKIKKRYLQVSSSDDDSYINVRGIDEDNTNEYIPLEYDALYDLLINKSSKVVLTQEQSSNVEDEDKEELKHKRVKKVKNEEPKKIVKEEVIEEVKPEVTESNEDRLAKLKAKLIKKTEEEPKELNSTPTFDEMIKEANEAEIVEEPVKVIPEVVQEEVKKEKTKEERLAELRARIRGGNS